MSAERIKVLRERLIEALTPQRLELEDDSAAHVNHIGARQGGGHFKVVISSQHFVGLLPLARHRLVYDAVGDLMGREIHALSIEAHLPS
ncbi:MAG: BolA family transcriptional regulator [Gammaproteobacteria bacterium]|nr:BolA family transcriptional regulator [Gammaproteobacteria bacterium]